ncbi:MAG: sigma-70 family RNA polymerase sigma factor [Bacillota bacterium]|nr:sigma-70 family RNA polymerase sigma factor [Bacillota bacterium]
MDIQLNLIRQCKKNDRNAFSLLLGQYESDVYRICYGYTRHHEDALDIAQEVFVKVFRAIETFDESRPFYPWLKKIAVNTCLNYQRAKQMGPMISLDYNYENGLALIDELPSADNPEELVLSRSMEETIAACMISLPESYRMALMLRYQEDMTYDEMASLMDQPLGTVKSNVYRARNMLKGILKKNGLLEV